jgi:hypothetical protein
MTEAHNLWMRTNIRWSDNVIATWISVCERSNGCKFSRSPFLSPLIPQLPSDGFACTAAGLTVVPFALKNLSTRNFTMLSSLIVGIGTMMWCASDQGVGCIVALHLHRSSMQCDGRMESVDCG